MKTQTQRETDGKVDFLSVSWVVANAFDPFQQVQNNSRGSYFKSKGEKDGRKSYLSALFVHF